MKTFGFPVSSSVEMVRVELGKLACDGLEGHFDNDPSVGARKALLHYAYKLKVGRRPIAAPRFLSATSEVETTFELRLDRETEAILAEEAERLGITKTRLATHAVFVYLAELDFLGVVPRQTP